ncbi:hypothetical protein SAMN04488063_2857 [Halopelagius inordinatus]|uniref:Tat (Twin-arginine translocation) pathway signal sequence n=1 Tax=Halopelagius inordinatus TaxID=553467 RepID=A0A1I2UBD7_9EURY|nr:hypothetical protein [Halopelagius inordinatus]SFG74390.1 hypothetical protein SAMN04488063_2857 [Halopelagius inordinatus]
MADRPSDTGRTDGDEEPTLLGRRDALRLGAAAAAVATGAAASSSSVAAEVQHNDISFDRRVNAVEDLGADPTGTIPIGGALGGAVDDGVFVEFPAGTYRVNIPIEMGVRTGFVGVGEAASDVQFEPTGAAGNRWLEFADTTDSIVGGFTVVGDTAGSIGGTVDGSVVLADVAYDAAVPARAGSRSHTLEIEWMGEDVTYEFTVEGTTEPGDDLTEGRAVTFGPSTEGYLTGGLHRFEYTGTLSDLRLSTEARVAVDGVEIDPAEPSEDTDVEFFAAAENTSATYDLVASRRASEHGTTLDVGDDDVVTVVDGIERLSIEGSALVDLARKY